MTGGSDDIDMLLSPVAPAPRTCVCLTPAGPFLAPDTPIQLLDTSSAPPVPDAPHRNNRERIQAILAFLSDPEKARVCIETQQIETPDFEPVTVSAALGKTRGASGPLEDTSDAAYAARHLKHERAERRLRRLEKEALVRDRRRQVERVARLAQVDVTKLVPVLEARRAAEPASDLPADRPGLLVYLRDLRDRLLSEARSMLQRYDTLLPDEALHDAEAASSVRRQPNTPATRGAVSHAVPVPRVVNVSTAPLAPPSPPSGTSPHVPRIAPSLAELAEAPDTPTALDPVTPPSKLRRSNSTRRKAASAFGERVPDCVSRREHFDDAMAEWMAATP